MAALAWMVVAVVQAQESSIANQSARWSPDQLQARYDELKFQYCVHPVTRRLVPAARVKSQVMFGTVTNFLGGRIVQLNSPHGLVAVFLDNKYRGQNGDEVEWLVRNYGSYTRIVSEDQSEVLQMFDDITMTPEVFMRAYHAGYRFDGRPPSMPGAPGRQILTEVKSRAGRSGFKSRVRIVRELDNKPNKLNRMPSQFEGAPVEIKRRPSQFYSTK